MIRSLVMTLHHGYGVRTIYGIRYGFQGFIPSYGHEPLRPGPRGGRRHPRKGRQHPGLLARASRTPARSWTACSALGVCLLFAIGGDGTLRGALAIHEEVKRRGLAIAVIGIPKTIDNDISFVEQTFGLETAFSVAAESIRSAHIEAKSGPPTASASSR